LSSDVDVVVMVAIVAWIIVFP